MKYRLLCCISKQEASPVRFACYSSYGSNRALEQSNISNQVHLQHMVNMIWSAGSILLTLLILNHSFYINDDSFMLLNKLEKKAQLGRFTWANSCWIHRLVLEISSPFLSFWVKSKYPTVVGAAPKTKQAPFNPTSVHCQIWRSKYACANWTHSHIAHKFTVCLLPQILNRVPRWSIYALFIRNVELGV